MTDRGSHSGDAVSGDEDVSVVDTLAVKLFCEMQEMVDKHEAARREAELWKAKKKSVSNILVPPPPPHNCLLLRSPPRTGVLETLRPIINVRWQRVVKILVSRKD